MTHSLTVRVSEELNDALEVAATEARTSKSELVRNYLQNAILDSDEPIPEHLRRELRRDRLKRRNRLEWQRVHFPSNVADKFRRAFEQGDLDGKLGKAAVEDIRDIYIEDAKLLFEDDPERCEAAVEFVNGVAEHAKEATDASDFDRLNPKEMFERYSGVEMGTEREGTDIRRVVEDARERLDGPLTDIDAVTTTLSKRHNISTELARECAEYAAGQRDSIEGVAL